MPPKGSKRSRNVQLSKARERKQSKCDDEGSDLEEEVPTFSDYDSDEDETFDPAVEELDEDAVMQVHVEEWLSTLDRDDVMSLTLYRPNDAKKKKIAGKKKKKKSRSLGGI